MVVGCWEAGEDGEFRTNNVYVGSSNCRGARTVVAGCIWIVVACSDVGTSEETVSVLEVIPMDHVAHTIEGVVTLEDDIADFNTGVGSKRGSCQLEVVHTVEELAVAEQIDFKRVPRIVGKAGRQSHINPICAIPSAEACIFIDRSEFDNGVSGDGVSSVDCSSPQAGHAAPGGFPVGRHIEFDGHRAGVFGEIVFTSLRFVETTL